MQTEYYKEIAERGKKWRDNLEQLSDEELRKVIRFTHRAECMGNERVYEKAIRSLLLTLGYDFEFIEGKFRDLMEGLYE